MSRHRLFYVLLFLLMAGSLHAQVKDAGLWTSLTLQKNLSRTLALSVSDEWRLNENITEVGTHFTEISLEQKLLQGLNVSVAYRFIQKRKVDDSYGLRHRLLTDVSYKKKFRNFSLTLRQRMQCQYTEVYSSPEGKVPDWVGRTKVALRYPLTKRWELSAFTENFITFIRAEGCVMDGIRYGSAVEYDIPRMGRIEVFYLINKELQKNDPWTDYVMGLAYKYTL